MSEVALAVKQFKDNLEISLQQRDSRLAIRSTQSSYTGEGARMLARLSALSMQELTTKRDPLVFQETTWEDRWTFPQYWDIALQLDKIEQAQSFQDPKSTFVEGVRAAIERKKDEVFLASIFSTALTGKNGTTSTTWASEGSAQVVLQTVGSGAAASRMNVAKLQAALKILKKNNVDRSYEDIFVGLDAEQVEGLYQEAVFISKEYTADAFKRNDQGIITDFMGFKFVEIEGLPNDGTYTRVPVWTRSSMDFGTWDSPMIDMFQDKATRGQPWTLYAYQSFGGARRDPKKIVEIKCKTTA